MVDLDALEAAAKAATQGEWKQNSEASWEVVVEEHPDVPDGPLIEVADTFDDGDKNAAYIIAAQPRAVLALLDEIERLRGALDKIADERMYRSGYCQTDIAVEPALTASEAQEIARAALAPKEKNDGE